MATTDEFGWVPKVGQEGKLRIYFTLQLLMKMNKGGHLDFAN